MLEIGKSKILVTLCPPCADGTATNSDSSEVIIVPSGTNVPILDSDFEVNNVDIGDIISVKTTGVNLTDGVNPISPSSIVSNGNKFDIEISLDVSVVTTDRFGNVLPTIIVNPSNPNLNWNSYDYCDFYLSRLLNPPVGAEETAFYTAYADLLSAGILQKAKAGIWFVYGGTSTDHKWNGVYPFDNRESGVLQYIGSPTHDSTGMTTNGTTQTILTRTNSNKFAVNNRQISIYKRNTNATPSVTATAFGYNLATNQGMYWRPNIDSVNGVANCEGTFFTATGMATANNGLITLRNDGIASVIRNGVLVSTGTGTADNYGCMAVGSAATTNNTVNNPCAVNCSYIYHGEQLTDAQEVNHYNIIQTLMTARGIQV